MEGSLTLILIPVANISKVKDSSIVVILAWEDDVFQISRMSVCNWMGCTFALAGTVHLDRSANTHSWYPIVRNLIEMVSYLDTF